MSIAGEGGRRILRGVGRGTGVNEPLVRHSRLGLPPADSIHVANPSRELNVALCYHLAMDSTKLRVGLYLRISEDRDGQQTTATGRQREDCRASSPKKRR